MGLRRCFGTVAVVRVYVLLSLQRWRRHSKKQGMRYVKNTSNMYDERHYRLQQAAVPTVMEE